ncbi:hypothetical protein NM208_g9784 [Fusarium decemcellulare]|uniref:Uncharacterized protein n=1 Tax=Fusarium decemcellulare TaxID=57161 RepID=A0ACC1S092_9HYPO|nr:hypothetical protein NM208_g9784 [Fusarium decemcellulare]
MYKSIPLDPQKREIRLLSLTPGSRDEIVSAELFRASLDNNPVFSVLSYSWGPENDKVPIQVQGRELLVTRNLYQCLVNLRSETTPLTIWIDAVCINQDSNDEKNTQVPLMRDIYKSASDTFIWLGETTSGLDLIIDSVRFTSCQEEGFRFAFTKFINLAWFRRTWIIQEFALPRQDPVFVCGNHHISWADLRKWWRLIEEPNGNVTHHSSWENKSPAWQNLHRILSSLPLANLASLRSGFSSNIVLERGLPLSVLIAASETSLATDPRDKIYGLMGLANAKAKQEITIDYNKSVQEVYEEVSKYLIFVECKLNVLSNQSLDLEPQWEQNDITPQNPQFKLRQGTNVTSSWIRDFAHVRSEFKPRPLLPDGRARGSTYDASLGTKPTEGPKCETGELSILGTEVDVIKECGRAWCMVPGKIPYYPDWNAILPLFFRAAHPAGHNPPIMDETSEEGGNKRKSQEPEWDLPYTPKYGAPKTMREAIWRTVTCDKVSDGIDRAPDYYGRVFDGYMDAVVGNSGGYEVPDHIETTLEAEVSYLNTLTRRINKILFRRSAFSTMNGWIGLGPDDMKEGDVVAILSGGDVPFVLRQCQCKNHYWLIGECYVEGIMYGEMMQALIKERVMPGNMFRIR